jgi:rod shape-determining protein MreC
MRNLFALLFRYQFFLLFVILEVVSLSLLFNSYSYHKSLAFNATSDFSGSVYSFSSDVTDYFSLKSENELLLEENTRMHNQLNSSFLLTDTNSVYRDSLYKFVSAKVVSNSVTKRNNFILINKGSLHGIKKEMGVISSSGLAGIVIGVSEHYAYIMSMLHQNSRISARIKKNGQLVNVIWNDRDYRTGDIIDIPSHIQLDKGDTIVTSGNSLIFPEGINIGIVTGQEKSENKSLGAASLQFSTDFNSLKHVYVIENLMREEEQNLINETIDE